MPIKPQEEAYEAYLYIKAKNKPLKMTNGTDITFTGAWANRMVAKP